ncbi:MAG: hypothetical protein HDT15_12275 [Oscillibacter sp.]|nr:hypothetical protein [Oscillibacter sp.]
MLLLVNCERDGFVDGTHLQWCCACSFEEAEKRARGTEQVNGNRITVAVVDELYDPYALGRFYKGLKRLDSGAPIGPEQNV